jgi:hypothetical protein
MSDEVDSSIPWAKIDENAIESGLEVRKFWENNAKTDDSGVVAAVLIS